MLKKIIGCYHPSAKSNDNNLILSLPDAITPVVWVLDMAEERTFAVKVEETNDGLFVLQKISRQNQTDDVAYYKTKKQAVNAMTIIANTMGPQGKSFIRSFINLIRIALIALVLLAVGFFATQYIKSYIGQLSINDAQLTSENPAQKEPSLNEIINNNDAEAMGVPMSADQFIENKMQSVLPF